MDLDPKWLSTIFGFVTSFSGMIWWTATQFSSTKKDIEALQVNMARIECGLKDILQELKDEAAQRTSLQNDIIRLQEKIKAHEFTLLRAQKMRNES